MATAAPRLSYSRIDRWEKCPLSYRFRYVDRIEEEQGDAAALGKAVHAAIETVERAHVREERRGAISAAEATRAWRDAFAEAGLVGAGVFEEGLELVLGFARDQGELDAYSVVAIEEQFELRIGEQTVIGVLDRVDRIDDETIEVIDFKTNRLLFARDDLATHLQLSLYCIAARLLWPWARNVRLTFWMLRHELKQRTTRTDEQLTAACEYVQAVAQQLAEAEEYPPRPNPLCGYCGYRRGCPAYAEMLEGKHELVARDLEDLEQVAREREEVARLSKTLYRRKDELDQILKAHLSERGSLELNGVRYLTFKVTSTEYPVERTVAVLSRETGRSEDEVRAEIAAVDNKALKRLLTKLGKKRSRAELKLIKSELEAFAEHTHTPRLWAKTIKETNT